MLPSARTLTRLLSPGSLTANAEHCDSRKMCSSAQAVAMLLNSHKVKLNLLLLPPPVLATVARR
jgi:hypothetical protein